jgi:hypothetical protein
VLAQTSPLAMPLSNNTILGMRSVKKKGIYPNMMNMQHKGNVYLTSAVIVREDARGY